jgi:hypothetical protein
MNDVPIVARTQGKNAPIRVVPAFMAGGSEPGRMSADSGGMQERIPNWLTGAGFLAGMVR